MLWPSERKKARLEVWGLYDSGTAPICFIAPSRSYSGHSSSEVEHGGAAPCDILLHSPRSPCLP